MYAVCGINACLKAAALFNCFSIFYGGKYEEKFANRLPQSLAKHSRRELRGRTQISCTYFSSIKSHFAAAVPSQLVVSNNISLV